MLDRFIYFKEVINLILNNISKLPNSKKKDINLDFYNIKEEE